MKDHFPTKWSSNGRRPPRRRLEFHLLDTAEDDGFECTRERPLDSILSAPMPQMEKVHVTPLNSVQSLKLNPHIPNRLIYNLILLKPNTNTPSAQGRV